MGSAGPVDVHVDFAELGRVHTELQNLLAQVEGLDQASVIRPDVEDLGRPVAAEAIAEFGRRWHTERVTMVENLAGCLVYLELAETSYGAAEQVIGAAVQTGLGIGSASSAATEPGVGAW